jgi:hypothetical protein
MKAALAIEPERKALLPAATVSPSRWPLRSPIGQPPSPPCKRQTTFPRVSALGRAVCTAGIWHGSGAPLVPLLERPSNRTYRVGGQISIMPHWYPWTCAENYRGRAS